MWRSTDPSASLSFAERLGFGGGGTSTLGASLSRLRSCRELWLDEVDDAAAGEIAAALRPNYARSLEVLGLSSGVSDDGGVLLCRALQEDGA